MFRNSLIIYILSFLLVGCSETTKKDLPENAIDPSVVENPATASTGKNEKKYPVMQFEKDIHDFGKIVEGEVVSYAFNFKNTGQGELVIRSANGSCGCTVPEFPKDPVKPGESGIITVTFSSEGRPGVQEKEVTIISNTMPNTYKIKIKANVEKAGS